MTASEALARTRELDARGPLRDRLGELESESRGWFETAEEFESRVREQLGAMGGPGAKAAAQRRG